MGKFLGSGGIHACRCDEVEGIFGSTFNNVYICMCAMCNNMFFIKLAMYIQYVDVCILLLNLAM